MSHLTQNPTWQLATAASLPAYRSTLQKSSELELSDFKAKIMTQDTSKYLTSVYVIKIPPFYEQKIIKQVNGTPVKSTKQVTITQCKCDYDTGPKIQLTQLFTFLEFHFCITTKPNKIIITSNKTSAEVTKLQLHHL